MCCCCGSRMCMWCLCLILVVILIGLVFGFGVYKHGFHKLKETVHVAVVDLHQPQPPTATTYSAVHYYSTGRPFLGFPAPPPGPPPY